MALNDRKITTYANPVSNLPDHPSQEGWTAAQLKAVFDAKANEEIKASINGIVDDLLAIIDGSSGADQVGATAINDLDGATVQAVLESLKSYIDTHKISTDHDSKYYTKTELNATDGVKGSAVIGTPAISGVSGTTIKDQLLSLKNLINSVVLGQIPDNTLTNAKLANDIKIGSLASLTTENKSNVVEAINEHEEQINSLAYQPIQFGCIGDGVADDTVNLQAAATQAAIDNAILDLGKYTYRITSPIQFVCSLDGKHAKIIADNISNSHAVLLGYDDNYILDKYFYTPVIENKVKNWTDGSIGLKISNTQNCEIHISKVAYFQTNLYLSANNSGNSYNNIFVNSLYDGKINFLLQTENSGWINENNIFIGRLGHNSTSGTNITDCRHIKMYSDTNGINNNSFYKACFEGNVKEYDLELVNASYNQFYGSRWESTTPKVLFNQINDTLYSAYNVFMFGYKIETVAVTENGNCEYNSFYTARAGNKMMGVIKTLSGTSDATPCYEIYSAVDKINSVNANDYLLSMSGQFIKGKRKIDLYPRIFIDYVNGYIKFSNGTINPVVYFEAYGSSAMKLTGGNLNQDGTWNGSHFIYGTRHEWYDSSGNKRAKNGVPANETDGVIISANPVV